MSRVIRWLTASVLVGVVGCDSEPIPDWLDKPRVPGGENLEGVSLKRMMKMRGAPGVSIAVFENYEIVWAEGFGVADVETGAKVDRETLFQAASVSKPVSAMAAMKLYQDGRYSLDDDINSILRSWTLPSNELTDARAVTPRMLLSHTAGTSVTGFDGYAPDATLPTLYQILSGQPPANSPAVVVNRPPDSEWRYSGGGFTIMQAAMEDLSEKPFAELMRTIVLDPIGMEHSTFDQPLSPEADRNATRGHGEHGDAWGPKYHVYPELAAAGLWTTPSDLCRFMIEFLRELNGDSSTVLSQETAALMATKVEYDDYGLGFRITKHSDGSVFIWHGGANWGFKAMIIGHRDKGYGAAIMANGDFAGPLLNEVQARIAEHFEWDGDF